MRDSEIDPVHSAANRLGDLLGPRRPWCFLSRDEASGELTIFSNRAPEEIKALLAHYLKRESKR